MSCAETDVATLGMWVTLGGVAAETTPIDSTAMGSPQGGTTEATAADGVVASSALNCTAAVTPTDNARLPTDSAQAPTRRRSAPMSRYDDELAPMPLLSDAVQQRTASRTSCASYCMHVYMRMHMHVCIRDWLS